MSVSAPSETVRGVSVQWRNGIWLPEIELALDPRTSTKRAFVSHAHSDHTGHHEHTLASAATARLMRERFGAGRGTFTELDFDQERDFGSFSARLLPAGHIVGSAQLYLQSQFGDLLYTGDFKLRESLSARTAKFCQAHTLILEATFGRPHYRFPPTAQVLADIRRFCRETIEDGETPVLLGYSLGKAQELIRALAGEGWPLALHPAVWEMTRLVQEIEASSEDQNRWPTLEKFQQQSLAGKVLICPPSVQGSSLLRKLPRKRVAMISGWALEPGAIHRYQCDAAFPLSDHADYPDLLRAVELVQPRRIYVVHGFAREFAADLRQRGYEAWALGQADQLELSIESRPVAAVLPNPTGGCATDSGWGRFCTLAEAVASSSGRLRKVALLADYLRRLPDADLPRAIAWLSGRTFPDPAEPGPALGPVLLRKALARLSTLPEMVFRQQARRFPDLGVAARELLPSPPQPQKLELSAVTAFFHRLATAPVLAAKLDLLTQQLGQLQPVEACYLSKILLGDLRIGLREGLINEAIARAFEMPLHQVAEAVMLLGDAGRVAVLARSRRLGEAGLVLFRPVQVMLAGVEPDAEAAWSRFASAETKAAAVWAEDKLDGIRAQIHHHQGQTEIFSREGRNITPAFPELIAALSAENRALVLDGEIVAWEGDRPRPFADLQKRLGRREPDLFLSADIPVRFLAFDLLFWQGQTLIGRPLQERRSLLESLPLTLPLAPAESRPVDSPKAIEAAFLAAKARGHEGLVLKNPDSPYTPGRRGLAWIKLKKALATLDVVIVAAQYGHGKRAGLLSDYTFAVRGPAGQLLTIGKAYTGLKDAEIEELTAELLALETQRTGGKITVRPWIVLEIAFDSIRASDRHSSGLALRFPRIKRIRRDKTPDQIDTLETARALLPGPSSLSDFERASEAFEV